jgi:hypothetical protein
MKVLLVAVLALSLTACGKVSQMEAKLTGKAYLSEDFGKQVYLICVGDWL